MRKYFRILPIARQWPVGTHGAIVRTKQQSLSRITNVVRPQQWSHALGNDTAGRGNGQMAAIPLSQNHKQLITVHIQIVLVDRL